MRLAKVSEGGGPKALPANGSLAIRDSGERRIGQAIARCLADLDVRGEAAAPFDRAADVLNGLVPAIFRGDADAARAAILETDLPTREVLDIALRARLAVRGRRPAHRERGERERAADAALRALAEREDPARPEDLDRRRQIATVHRRLLTLLSDGVLTARPDGRLLHANRMAREALGLRLRDLRETPLRGLFAEKADAERMWRSVKDDGIFRGREVDLRAATGRTFPVRLAAARAEGPDPRILLVFRDLTEIRHIRSRLIETEKLGAMAKVAGSVAHEIRNPLNALFLNADLLEEELADSGNLPPAIEETLRVMREEIERLNEIIKNYLSLSKLGHSNFERLELNEVVKDFAEEAEEMAGRRKVTLDLRLCRGETTVRADRNMLRRVLVNLVQNALDVSQAGGRILLGTRRLLHRVRLSVRDRGPGVAAEALPHLFQPFFSTKERGTGLGLYLCREIVMAHVGEVALRSVKPCGAQATVLLPRWRDGADESGGAGGTR
ncbi:MAG TPA: ATP-binding protein [Planctomycetota bacterium]|nr:ATP-binding protein [Planctomycetota bacterium]